MHGLGFEVFAQHSIREEAFASKKASLTRNVRLALILSPIIPKDEKEEEEESIEDAQEYKNPFWIDYIELLNGDEDEPIYEKKEEEWDIPYLKLVPQLSHPLEKTNLRFIYQPRLYDMKNSEVTEEWVGDRFRNCYSNRYYPSPIVSIMKDSSIAKFF